MVRSDREKMAQFFREVILRHALEPVGRDKPIAATHSAERDNPLCGDHVKVELRIVAGRVVDASFSGEACSVCVASCALLCTHAPGMDTLELQRTQAAFSAALHAPSAGAEACAPFLQPLLGLTAFPARKACATLPWETAIDALDPIGSE